ncbi:MAG: hypothetical protein P8179_04390 [Candidatus Thiodiazotropha sp.]
MKVKILIILMCAATSFSGCSSYKPREAGFFKVGYEEIELDSGKYQLTYYGSDHDNVDDVKRLWHRRANELCSGADYKVDKEQAGVWNSNGYVVLPPVLVATDNSNLSYRGEVLCKSE